MNSGGFYNIHNPPECVICPWICVCVCVVDNSCFLNSHVTDIFSWLRNYAQLLINWCWVIFKLVSHIFGDPNP